MWVSVYVYVYGVSVLCVYGVCLMCAVCVSIFSDCVYAVLYSLYICMWFTYKYVCNVYVCVCFVSVVYMWCMYEYVWDVCDMYVSCI